MYHETDIVNTAVRGSTTAAADDRKSWFSFELNINKEQYYFHGTFGTLKHCWKKSTNNIFKDTGHALRASTPWLSYFSLDFSFDLLLEERFFFAENLWTLTINSEPQFLFCISHSIYAF